MAQSSRAVPRPVPAELERRFYAYALDRALGWGLAAVVGVLAWSILDHRVLPALLAAAGVVVVLGVSGALLLGTGGASPGRAALGLRVVDVGTGQPCGAGRALARAAILGVAGLPTAGIGVASLAWTAAMDGGGHRRGWHDRRAGTLVVDVRPPPVGDVEVVAAPQGMVNLTAMRLRPAPAPATLAPTVAPPTSGQAADPPSPAAWSEPPGVTERRPPRQERPAAVAAPASVVRWQVSFDSGEIVVVEGPVLIGRGPQPRPGEEVRHVVPLRSSDMSLSKTHAQLQVADDGALVVTDRGSTNGSALVRRGMSRPLAAGRPTTLVDGDRVTFGDREMRVARGS